MSVSTITFYPVDNGAMALLKLNDDAETTILVDMFIRPEADDPDGEKFDVASHLRTQLKKDEQKRPYVDVFLLSHNDDDHIKGVQEHFHLGAPDDYTFPEDEDAPVPILIQEMWSSARFWQRSSSSNKLSDDAKAFNREMKRRVKLFQDSGIIQAEGDRAIIIGKDPDGKTDGLETIVRDIDTAFSKINGRELASKILVRVLGPLPQQEDEEDEEFQEANRSSVIIQVAVREQSLWDSYENLLILPGDAEVFVWECLWNKHEGSDWLDYDILLTPHHCSWHSLSYDSESECDDPQVSEDAKNALSQAKEGAYAMASSKPIKDDDETPPSQLAKNEYVGIVGHSRFLCTGEHPDEKHPQPIVMNLTADGPQLKPAKSKPRTSKVATAAAGVALPHGGND